jgi:polysaccharide biosynthesis/export protein
MINLSHQKKWPAFPGLFLICIYLIGMSFFTSCTVTRPGNYFRTIKGDTTVNVPPRASDNLKIKPGDKLAITVSSLNKDEDLIYNTENSIGYEVSQEGTIHIRRLGKLSVQGLTRKQAKQKIEEGLVPYLKDPLVSIKFTNHHVTLIGAAGNTKVLPMPEERISIIDLLAEGGSLTETNLLSDVVVIRDSSDTQKNIKHLNLEDNSVFESGYFYLQPFDVVVVSSNEKAIMDEKKRLRYQQIATLSLQVVTISLVIYQTFFRN